MSFKIGNINIDKKIVLAPMAGISNPAFIKICEEFGVSLAFTELISAEAIVRNNEKTFAMLNGINDIKIPVGVQIFGSGPKVMAEAAKKLVDKYNIKIIDINMGCPVPKVALKNNAGSALLKDIPKIREIVSEVVKSVSVPVTVKIRSGWDEDIINAVEVAKVCEESGASLITVHARTRSQGYSGKADWQIIKQVKESVHIPVIGNGDVKTCYDAKRMLDETNCDAVMIGRALLGNPWLIKECNDYLENNIIPNEVSITDRIDMIRKHIELLSQIKVEKVAILEMRSIIMYYLKKLPNTKNLKIQICKINTKEELLKLLEKYEKELEVKQ